MNEKSTIQIPLSAEQQAQIRQTTGKSVAALQLKLTEVEQRLAPGIMLN
jgi:hypothetical protein